MSDEKPGPLRVTTCYDPTGRTESCWSLVENTPAARQAHRAWHAHEASVKDGFRRAIKARDEEIAKLSRELVEARADVREIKIPEPVLGIEIDRDGWDDEPAPTVAEDDAWAEMLTPGSSDRPDDRDFYSMQPRPHDDEQDLAATRPMTDDDWDPHAVELPTTSPTWPR